jgi:catechol 2,3-dioxygenase-like lactoylglutathione lyase family enzyme
MIIKLLRVTLIVRDQEEAFRFYTEKLGFEKRADQPMGENTRWLTIAPKEDHDLEIVLQPLDWFEGEERKEHAALVGKNPTMVFHVDDCQKTYDLLWERGVKFEQSPQKRPYGLEALAKDLYGNTLDLLETHN